MRKHRVSKIHLRATAIEAITTIKSSSPVVLHPAVTTTAPIAMMRVRATEEVTLANPQLSARIKPSHIMITKRRAAMITCVSHTCLPV